MIHPTSADEAIELLLMLVGELGLAAHDLAVTVPTDMADRFARLRQLGLDQAALAAAGEAILRNRAEPAP